jgi:hypothetical protein
MTKHAFTLISFLAASLLVGCGGGGTGTGNPGNISLQSAPLSGPNAASLRYRSGWFARVLEDAGQGLMDILVGDRSAFAAVSSFATFKMCNDTLVMTDVNGKTVPVNGSTNQAGLGVLTFSSTSTSPMLLTRIDVPANTQITEIDITSAVVPDVCSGFGDAVLFDPGSGPIHISQNTAFKFKFATPLNISGSAQTLNVLFGSIVSQMVALGQGLNNSNIQSIAASGTAQ